MSRITILALCVTGSILTRPLFAQEGFTQPWTDAPVTEIARGNGESGISVTYQSNLTLSLKRGNEVVAAEVDGCRATLEVFFKCFPGNGKLESGLNLGPGIEQNDFGCQIVMIFTAVSGNWTNLNVQQVITDLVLKLTHKEANPPVKELCFGPTSNPVSQPPLPRFDVTVNATAAEFVQVSGDTWVYADTPRFRAFDIPAGGLPLGVGGTNPPGGNVIHSGDVLKLRRSFITYWFGECGTSSSISSSAVAGDPLLFYVRWCCAHEMETAATAAGWTGKCIHCSPGSPQPFTVAPPPLGGKKLNDFNDATQQLNQASASQPYHLDLSETIQALPMCPKGF
jgi:hypothetical protein